MNRIHTHLVLLAACALLAAVPSVAMAAKPTGAGSSATRAGDNLAELISDNLTQLLVVLVGVFGIAAFAARSIGQAMMIVVIGLFAGVFIIEPDGALNLFKGIYDAIL